MKTQLELFFAKCAYNQAMAEFQHLPFLKKLFTKLPVDPSPKGVYTLFDEFVQQLKAKYGVGRCIVGSNGSSVVLCAKPGDDGSFVIRVTVYDGSCYHEETKLFRPDGSTETLPIRYPFSECGVSGLGRIPAGVLSEEQMDLLHKYRNACDDVALLIRTIARS